MKEMELPEIVRTWVINTVVGVIEDDVKDTIGYGLDNSRLYEALIVGLLRHETPKVLLQADLAEMLMCHTRTIRVALKRLEEKGHVRKEGLPYRLIDEPLIPLWVKEFTKAMIDLRFDDDLLAVAREASAKIYFRRGLQAIRDELREKYYRPRKEKSDGDNDQTDD